MRAPRRRTDHPRGGVGERVLGAAAPAVDRGDDGPLDLGPVSGGIQVQPVGDREAGSPTRRSTSAVSSSSSSTPPPRNATSSRSSASSWVPASRASTAADSAPPSPGGWSRRSRASAPSAARAFSSSPRAVNCVARTWRRSSSPLDRRNAAGQLGRAGDLTPAEEVTGQAHAEQPEHPQQVPALLHGEPERRRTVREAVGRDQHLGGGVVVGLRQPAQGPELGLGQPGRRLGEQAGHGHDRSGRAGARAGRPGSGRPPAPRDASASSATAADLVGPGQHADGVDRRRPARVVVLERLEEADVGPWRWRIRYMTASAGLAPPRGPGSPRSGRRCPWTASRGPGCRSRSSSPAPARATR